MTNFDKAFQYTLGNEGGYSNSSLDNGGPTNWGITQATLSQWRGHLVSMDEVKLLSQDEAKEIYKDRYWDIIDLGEIWSPAISTCLFDQSVNCGPSKSIKMAQTSCGITVDGFMGPQSIMAFNAKPEDKFVEDFVEACIAHYQAIVAHDSSQRVFLNGWMNRAHRMLSLLKS